MMISARSKLIAAIRPALGRTWPTAEYRCFMEAESTYGSKAYYVTSVVPGIMRIQPWVDGALASYEPMQRREDYAAYMTMRREAFASYNGLAQIAMAESALEGIPAEHFCAQIEQLTILAQSRIFKLHIVPDEVVQNYLGSAVSETIIIGHGAYIEYPGGSNRHEFWIGANSSSYVRICGSHLSIHNDLFCPYDPSATLQTLRNFAR